MIGAPQWLVTFASALSATALNALWQDALLVVCIALLLRFWRGINASTRYVVWSVTLIAAILLPIATTLSFFATPPPVAASTSFPAARHVAANVKPSTIAVRPSSGTGSAAVQAPARLPERLTFTLPEPVAFAVFALWLLLAGYAMVRLVIGLVRLEQLKRDALPLPVAYRDALPQWARANKGARDVRLCVSDETDVPVAVGLFDSMILVPHSLLERLSEGEVDQICLHELAHLRRADDWTNGIQRIIIALLGWNPAAQFVGQQLDLEREVACDDWVLSFVQRVRPYALCLTKMAENASWPREPIPAPGVFATRKHISLRIERLLGAGRNIATNLSFAPAAVALSAVAAIALVITMVAPSIAAPYAATAVSTAAATAHVAANQSTAPKQVIKYVNRIVHVATASTSVPAPAQPKGTTHVEVPATHVSVPATHVNVPATHVEIPATHVDVPGTHVNVPGASFDVPGVDAKALSAQIRATINEQLLHHMTAKGVASGNSCAGCDFHGVNWPGRDLRGANYNGVDFSKANLAGVNLSGSFLNGADFSAANLANASFRNAHLTGCDFSNANLTGADFTGAWMSGCRFTHARLASAQLRSVLSGCKGCDFSHADLSGLDLHAVRTNGDDFSGADLRGVNFAGAQLVGNNFTNAKLDGANFDGATLDGCDLGGVDLSRVVLSRANLVDTDLPTRRSPP